jgi:Rieske Fe-S protein
VTELDQRPADAGASGSGPTRRQVLVTGGVVAAAAVVTAACGSSSGSTDAGSPSSSGSSGSSGGGTQVATSDVPVGGGMILTDQKVVVTQPSAGEYKAFTAVCTHQGCVVASVADGVITCPCHGSTFSIADGSVTGGPAKGPLAAVPVTVSGSEITIS